jgi:PD-(D/E)XK nuclease superfamily
MTIVPHWSASRFMLYDQCPAEFKARYIDGVALEATEALCFGSSMHLGLEAHFRGDDGVRAFRAAWRTMSQEQLGGRVDSRLTARGLDLLEAVFELGLEGVPERPFTIDTEADLLAPTIGFMDLYDQGSNTVYDFKTTLGSWSQERAQKETWQPLLYTWAAWEVTGEWPAFEYVVLNRATGRLDRFRRQWTHDEWLEQIATAWADMRTIALAVSADVLTCHGKHGWCPECGDRWTHEHECRPNTPRVSLYVRDTFG